MDKISNPKNVLVTGGAGFIGSNLVKRLLADERFHKVKVLDNLSTGFLHNLKEFESNPDFEFIEGDIRDFDTCKQACSGVDLVSHQAALGSVPRSVKDPLTTNGVNITGTLNIYTAAKETKVERIVYAASSSTYGDSKGLPKVEEKIGNPLSPYAVTKYVMELYAKVFHDLYKIDFIGLRYFNVFGPKQDPNGAYAAVIPLFFKHAIRGTNPTINGDGSFSRDFTFVDNAVQANILALTSINPDALNQVYNVACAERTDLNQLWAIIKRVTESKSEVIHGPERDGDIPHSLASIDKAIKKLDYNPNIKIDQGIQEAYRWYNKSAKEQTTNEA